jgi:predicted ferric reductase
MSPGASDEASLDRRVYYVIAIIAAIYLYTILVLLQTPHSNLYYFFTRLSVLLGAASLFIAIMAAAFARKMHRFLGWRFRRVHHLFVISGLVLITLHPLIQALQYMNFEIFVPRFASWNGFWGLAGRPALILIYVALVAAMLHRIIPRYWRILHMLIYITLVFGAAHGLILGSDSRNLLLVVPYVIMLVLSLGVFFYKRSRHSSSW